MLVVVVRAFVHARERQDRLPATTGSVGALDVGHWVIADHVETLNVRVLLVDERLGIKERQILWLAEDLLLEVVARRTEVEVFHDSSEGTGAVARQVELAHVLEVRARRVERHVLLRCVAAQAAFLGAQHVHDDLELTAPVDRVNEHEHGAEGLAVEATTVRDAVELDVRVHGREVVVQLADGDDVLEAVVGHDLVDVLAVLAHGQHELVAVLLHERLHWRVAHAEQIRRDVRPEDLRHLLGLLVLGVPAAVGHDRERDLVLLEVFDDFAGAWDGLLAAQQHAVDVEDHAEGRLGGGRKEPRAEGGRMARGERAQRRHRGGGGRVTSDGPTPPRIHGGATYGGGDAKVARSTSRTASIEDSSLPRCDWLQPKVQE